MNNFTSWWQHLPERIDPVIFQLGSFRVQYYGLMYIVAFLIVYFLSKYRSSREPNMVFTDDFHKDLMTAAFIGVLIGGRLGYVLFYNLSYYLEKPLEIILPFEFDPFRFVGISGMSYHGGVAGVMVAVWIFARRYHVGYFKLSDLYCPIIPLGYTFGRLGNFINGELYGRVTESSIGMYFLSAPTKELRHPSQLYEAFFEGIFCFCLLWFTRRVHFPEGSRLGFYLISYGVVRFFIEFFRQPDTHLGFVFLNFSMGQMLCLGMIAAGIFFLILASRRQRLLQNQEVL